LHGKARFSAGQIGQAQAGDPAGVPLKAGLIRNRADAEALEDLAP